MRVLVLTFVLIFIGISKSSAQWTPVDCVDTNLVNPYYICPYFEYVPRCGCDGKTYISDCDMRNRGGVNFPDYDGPCEELNFEIHPTLTNSQLFFSSSLKYQGVEVVQIYNTFGLKMFEQNFKFSYAYQTYKEYPIDVSSYEYGMYFVVATANGYAQVEKFIVAGTAQ